MNEMEGMDYPCKWMDRLSVFKRTSYLTSIIGFDSRSRMLVWGGWVG